MKEVLAGKGTQAHDGNLLGAAGQGLRWGIGQLAAAVCGDAAPAKLAGRRVPGAHEGRVVAAPAQAKRPIDDAFVTVTAQVAIGFVLGSRHRCLKKTTYGLMQRCKAHSQLIE
jgi:hypothetical protein